MKERKARWVYWLLWVLFEIAFFIWHPFSHVCGKENIPKDGGSLIVCNHCSMADPIWILMALGPRSGANIMAKKELMEIPVLRAILRWVGVFGVDRGGADIAAVKHSLEILKNGENLLIFPEGTRMRPGKQVEPKTGAALLAQRAGVPVVPVYITQKKRPFCPIRLCFGKSYEIQAEGRRITAAELDTATTDMMRTIYALGEAK